MVLQREWRMEADRREGMEPDRILAKSESDVEPQVTADSLRDMTMQELAVRLERVTARIEVERAKEREARAVYERLASEVKTRVDEIRSEATLLVDEQRRRLASFGGFVDEKPAPLPPPERFASKVEPKPDRRSKPRTLEDAILEIWAGGHKHSPLTTDEIAHALPEVGYESKAAWRSLKSTVNQALAKLCNGGKMSKFRIDGSPLPESNPNLRARRYMPPPEGDGGIDGDHDDRDGDLRD